MARAPQIAWIELMARADREALYGPSGATTEQAMVERIFQNYSTPNRYNERVGAGEAVDVNNDIDFLTSQWLGPLARAAGIDIAPQQMRYFADQVLRGNLDQDGATEGMRQEAVRNGFMGADGTTRPYVDPNDEGEMEIPEVVNPGNNNGGGSTGGSTGGGGGGDTGGGGGGGGGGTEPPPDTFDYDTFDLIKSLLFSYGLDSLVGTVELWIQEEASEDEIELRLHGEQAFKDRFPAIRMIDELNQGVGPGQHRANISPRDYMDLEDDYFGYLSRVGLADAFFTRDRVAWWIFGGNSPLEISRRVTNGVSAMQLASEETRDFFRDTYGVDGDVALAAYMLDPGNLEDELTRQVEVSQIGGRSTIANIGIGAAGAKRLAELGISAQEAGTQFQNINRRGALFRESVSESTDLTKEGAGVDSAFGLDDGKAEDQLAKRLRARQAAFRGGGGAFVNNRTSGFGSA